MAKKKKAEKNFIDFILDAQKDFDLVKEFMFLRGRDEIEAYFEEKEYNGITPDDMTKIVEMKQAFDEGLDENVSKCWDEYY